MATTKPKNTSKPSDQPKTIHLTFSDLKSEAAAPDPFTVQFPNGFVTFPDIFDRDMEEGQKFLEELQDWGRNDLEMLEKWLPKKDFEILKAAKLKFREHGVLMDKVVHYYRNSLGSPGESNASAGS